MKRSRVQGTRRSPAGGSSWRWLVASSWAPWSSATWYRSTCLCAALGRSTCHSGLTGRRHQTTTLHKRTRTRKHKTLVRPHIHAALCSLAKVEGFPWPGKQARHFAAICSTCDCHWVHWHATTCCWTLQGTSFYLKRRTRVSAWGNGMGNFYSAPKVTQIVISRKQTSVSRWKVNVRGLRELCQHSSDLLTSSLGFKQSRACF